MIHNPLVFDAETSVIADVADYANDIGRPPARTKDPEKIAAWIENAKERQASFAALDLDLARVVSLCWTTDGIKLRGGVARNETEEGPLIRRFWEETRGFTYVGFNILDFDLPLLIRRSQYLDVPYPDVSVDRYRHQGVADLQQILTWNGKVNARKLTFYCRRFKVEVPEDKHTGADIPTLVLLGTDDAWAGIKRHNAVDVIREWRLAVRLGVIEPVVNDPDSLF